MNKHKYIMQYNLHEATTKNQQLSTVQNIKKYKSQ